MALELIELTPDNLHTALNENFRRIYAEIARKVPLNGNITLEGDWDFQGLYTVLGPTPDGEHSAYCPTPITGVEDEGSP